MKNISIIFFLFIFSFCSAQQTKLELGYKYLYNPNWDKAIQTYNFSRPFQEEKQPLLMNGIKTSINHLSKSSTRIQHGFGITYNFFKSESDNSNFVNTLSLHILSLNYLFHYQITNKLYFEAILSPIVGGLFRKINYNSFEIDGERFKGLGIGGQLNTKAGYNFDLNEKLKLSPFIDLGYTPYLYESNFESLLNQTSNLTGKSWSWNLSFELGVAFQLLHQKR